jgi:hypothetical protein
MYNWCICWFFTHILLGILIFKGLTARRLYKSFGVKGLSTELYRTMHTVSHKNFPFNPEVVDYDFNIIIGKDKVQDSDYPWTGHVGPEGGGSRGIAPLFPWVCPLGRSG